MQQITALSVICFWTEAASFSFPALKNRTLSLEIIFGKKILESNLIKQFTLNVSDENDGVLMSRDSHVSIFFLMF